MNNWKRSKEIDAVLKHVITKGKRRVSAKMGMREVRSLIRELRKEVAANPKGTKESYRLRRVNKEIGRHWTKLTGKKFYG